ncbi:MAG: hypothetical protein CVU11_12230 [Bacteroidetes bacterium HGW-Bacteroidetes-6]|jgi:hypothetical protein|nr:MAG: hypothetical protein CVU11_12230 [Bacteroidetes bacterium HGW-Bacteroidetes-6]
MSKYQNFFPDETIIAEVQGFLVKGLFGSKMGTAILTDKRIAFIEKKQVVGVGLIGALAAEATGITKPKLKLDIPITEVFSWERPRKNDIRITTKVGEKHLIRPVNYDEWDAKLKGLQKK